MPNAGVDGNGDFLVSWIGSHYFKHYRVMFRVERLLGCLLVMSHYSM